MSSKREKILSDEEIEALMKDFDTEDDTESESANNNQPDIQETKTTSNKEADNLTSEEPLSGMPQESLDSSEQAKTQKQSAEDINKVNISGANEDVILSDDEIEALIDVFGAKKRKAVTTEFEDISSRGATLEILGTEESEEELKKDNIFSSMLVGSESNQAWQKRASFFNDLCSRFELVLSNSLSSFLGGIRVFTEKLPIGRSTYRNVLDSSLADPENMSCIILFAFQDNSINVNDMVELDLNLVFLMVDLFLGGDGLVIPNKKKVTDFERNIVSKIMSKLRNDLSKIWHPSLELRASPPRVFSYLDLAETSFQEQPVITFPFKITLQNSERNTISGNFIVHIPYSIMSIDKMYIDNIDTKAEDRKEKSQISMKEKIMDVPLCLQARFPPVSITFGELLELKKGDTIKLNITTQDKIVVKIEDKTKFLGVPRLVGNMKAVEICDTPFA